MKQTNKKKITKVYFASYMYKSQIMLNKMITQYDVCF